jgi:hypothetical protein
MLARFTRKKTGVRKLQSRLLGFRKAPAGRLRMMRATPQSRDPVNAIGVGVGLLLIIVAISLLLLVLRRKARDTTPGTSVPEEGEEGALPVTEVVEDDEEITPPVTEVVLDEMAEAAEYVPPREESPPGEERPERRGATPAAPPASREEPPPGEERPDRRTP